MSELETRIVAIGRQIERIGRRLEALGYEFDEPGAVFPGPEAGTEEAIARIEGEVGPLPLAIKLFWRRVGSVNFVGGHPDWQGCQYPDPLVVYPPSVALSELDAFLEDRTAREEDGEGYLVPIAPDDYHKANVSGGMWYNLTAPATVDDPPLNDERHGVTFVEYLELAVRWGGFPGLDRCPGHRWPVEEIGGAAG